MIGLTVAASGPEDDPLSYRATGLPPGIVMGYATGVIAGTVDYSAAEQSGGSYAVTVFPADGNGDSGIATFTWIVTATNRRPVLWRSPSDRKSL